MRILHYFFLISCCLLSSQLFAQKKKITYKNKFRPIRMSKSKASVICPIFESSEYPYHGIGVKVGDPVAITYKYYESERFAIALDAGSAASGLYNKYHRESFENFLPDSLGAITTIQYVQHEVINEYVFEGKLLYQTKADELFRGLQFYIGIGWQFRKVNIKYSYFYEFGFNERESGNLEFMKIVQGPVVTAGLEYAYFTLPISAFIEVAFFSDVSDNPGWTRFQGGVGARYVF